jgi:hypothetical protein
MKKLAILFASMFIMAITVQNVNAQYDASDVATAAAWIITPIEIEVQENLAFGNIIASASAGSVTVDFADGRSNSGGATFPTTPGTVKSAEFEVTGFSNSAYTITLPEDDVVYLTGDGVDMEITDFVHNANETLDGSGNEVFQVGATLQVNADQAAGEYTGSFEVVVNYN